MFLINEIKFIIISTVCFAFLPVSDSDKNDSNAEQLMSVPSIYYNINSKTSLRVSSIENNLSNELEPINLSPTKTDEMLRRISYRSNGCTCQELTCGCCIGMNIQQFQFNREGCMNLTYDPLEFAIGMTMLVNGEPIFTNSISAKNPPALCIPVPIPYLPASVDFCAKVFDVYTPGQNLHMCLDFETRIQTAPVLVLHFDCMRMGNDGIALLKPGSSPAPVSSTGGPQLGSDVYDEVTEIKY